MKHASFSPRPSWHSVLAVAGGAKDIQLPPDGVQLTPSPLPGYAKAQANCTCATRPNTCATSRPTRRARIGTRWCIA